MADRDSWRELLRSDDLHEVMTVATTIAAMGFDLRLFQRGGRPIDHAPPEADPADPRWRGRGPFSLCVPSEDWPDLHDVLDEIIREQREFDERLASRERQTIRASRLVWLGAGTIAGTLATIRAIEL